MVLWLTQPTAKLVTLLEQHINRQPPTVVIQATTWWETTLVYVMPQECGLGVHLPVMVCCWGLGMFQVKMGLGLYQVKMPPKVQKVMIMFSDWIPIAFSGLAIWDFECILNATMTHEQLMKHLPKKDRPRCYAKFDQYWSLQLSWGDWEMRTAV